MYRNSPLNLKVTSGGPGQCAWDIDHATLTTAPRLALTQVLTPSVVTQEPNSVPRVNPEQLSLPLSLVLLFN